MTCAVSRGESDGITENALMPPTPSLKQMGVGLLPNTDSFDYQFECPCQHIPCRRIEGTVVIYHRIVAYDRIAYDECVAA
jgi:hypothetical protein